MAEERYQDEPDPPRPERARRPRRDDADEAEAPRRRSRRDEDEDQEEGYDRGGRRIRREDDGGLNTLIPYKNPKALIAYYLGVFSLIPCVGGILGPTALILGILGLKYRTLHPTAGGTGHAWAGIILGSLTLLANLGAAIFFGVVAAKL